MSSQELSTPGVVCKALPSHAMNALKFSFTVPLSHQCNKALMLPSKSIVLLA